MSINLLDMLKDQVTGSLAKQASSFLGESESNVTSALGGVFPALLGSVIDKASKPSEASGLMDMISGMDTGMLGDIGGLFGGGASSVNGLLNSGGGIVESLLGNKMGGVVEMISKVSGLKSGSSSSLMKMAAPFLMGIIGKQIKGKGLGFLTDMLMGQKDHVAKALPSGMDNLLGLGFANMGDSLRGAAASVTGAAGAAVSGVSNSANKAAGAATGAISGAANATRGAAGSVANAAGGAASTGLGWIKWALPLLVIGGLAWYFLGKGNPVDALGDAASATTEMVGDAAGTVADAAGDAVDATGNAVGDAASAAGDMISGAFSNVNEAAKAALGSITFGANSAGSQMMDFINGGFKGDGKVTFRNLTFASGSDKIDGTSGVEVDHLAAILKAYPDVKINVAGYTDNQGNAASNQTLSENRAKSVKQRLMDAGIAPERIATAGYGDAQPVASNDTAEGRAENRRIEVTIAK